MNFPALTSGKRLGITATALLTIGYLAVTAHEMLSSCRRRGDRTREETDVEMQNNPQITVTGPETQQPFISEDVPTSPLSPHRSRSPRPSISTGTSAMTYASRSRRHRRHNWATNMDPMLLGIFIFQFIVFAYFIVSTELLLKHNPQVDSSDREWGFGQVSRNTFRLQ